jgi:hypothetical protein
MIGSFVSRVTVQPGVSNDSTVQRLGSDRAEGHNTCANRPHIRSDCALRDLAESGGNRKPPWFAGSSP